MNLEFDLKRSPLNFKKKHLSINDISLTYDGKTFLFKEITDIKYGSFTIYANGIKTNTAYEFQFRRHSGDKITISFSAAGLIRLSYGKEKEEIFLQIRKAVWPTVIRLANQYLADLHNGKSVVIKNLEIKKDGIYITKRLLSKFFRKKTFHIPWDNVRSGEGNGRFVLRSADSKKISSSLCFLKEWNANIISLLIDYLFKEGRCFKLGEKKFEIT